LRGRRRLAQDDTGDGLERVGVALPERAVVLRARPWRGCLDRELQPVPGDRVEQTVDPCPVRTGRQSQVPARADGLLRVLDRRGVPSGGELLDLSTEDPRLVLLRELADHRSALA